MRTPQPRLGTYVTIRDREYQANSRPAGGQVTIFSVAETNPDPELFTRDQETGHWIATVATADCDFVMSVTTVARWKGQLCAVMSISDDGQAVLHHLGNNRAKFRIEAGQVLEPGTYARTVPVSELTSYYETHHDLIFADWAHSMIRS